MFHLYRPWELLFSLFHNNTKIIFWKILPHSEKVDIQHEYLML